MRVSDVDEEAVLDELIRRRREAGLAAPTAAEQVQALARAKALDVAAATELAWQRVWNDTQSGELKRAFTVDYELSEVESGKTTCTVYIALP